MERKSLDPAARSYESLLERVVPSEPQTTPTLKLSSTKLSEFLHSRCEASNRMVGKFIGNVR